MIFPQVINYVLEKRQLDILIEYAPSEFEDYKQEIEYILDHHEEFGEVPSRQLFLGKFPEFTIIEVLDSEEALRSSLSEAVLYSSTVTVINETVEILKEDSIKAVDHLLRSLDSLSIKSNVNSEDIVKTIQDRLDIHSKAEETVKYIPSGFPHIDKYTNGYSKGEDLIVMFARTGHGKSWFLLVSLHHAWTMGYNVGIMSPEMSPRKIGYRFDTISSSISNKDLIWGNPVKEYITFVESFIEANHATKFLVTTPKDFHKNITVPRLKKWCIDNNIQVLGIDGITYLTDHRSKRGDTKTMMLTNIAEDLMDMSIELGIPITIIVQSNRGGVGEGGPPELENIRDSDGIAHNASKVFSLKQSGNELEVSIKKNRDYKTGQCFKYRFDPDRGKIEYANDTSSTNKPSLEEY